MTRGSKRKRTADAHSEDATAVVASVRTNDSTKRAYTSKMRVMAAWLTTHFPHAVDAHAQTVLVPAPKKAILAFFRRLCSAADACDEQNVLADGAAATPMSVSCVEGYRSALLDQHRSQQLTLEPTLDTELSQVLDGYETQIDNLKERGLMKGKEAKIHLNSSGYAMLAAKLLKAKPDKKGQSRSASVFMWSYLVLMWNLMGRSDSIDTLMLEHME